MAWPPKQAKGGLPRLPGRSLSPASSSDPQALCQVGLAGTGGAPSPIPTTRCLQQLHKKAQRGRWKSATGGSRHLSGSRDALRPLVTHSARCHTAPWRCEASLRLPRGHFQQSDSTHQQSTRASLGVVSNIPASGKSSPPKAKLGVCVRQNRAPPSRAKGEHSHPAGMSSGIAKGVCGGGSVPGAAP